MMFLRLGSNKEKGMKETSFCSDQNAKCHNNMSYTTGANWKSGNLAHSDDWMTS
jgi:hypothetical protein